MKNEQESAKSLSLTLALWPPHGAHLDEWLTLSQEWQDKVGDPSASKKLRLRLSNN